MFLPEYEIGLLADSISACKIRLDEKNYPLEAIYEAALLYGFSGKDVTKKQIEMLKSSNNIIRYWAVWGLCQIILIIGSNQ